MIKKAVFALALLFICSLSCKKKEREGSSEEDSTEVIFSEKSEEKNIDSERIKDCDDFLDHYEDWSKDYIEFMEKYKDNPLDAISDPEYSEMMTKALSWSQDWVTIAASCSRNSSYEKRMEKITENVEEKMKELGF